MVPFASVCILVKYIEFQITSLCNTGNLAGFEPDSTRVQRFFFSSSSVALEGVRGRFGAMMKEEPLAKGGCAQTLLIEDEVRKIIGHGSSLPSAAEGGGAIL